MKSDRQVMSELKRLSAGWKPIVWTSTQIKLAECSRMTSKIIEDLTFHLRIMNNLPSIKP